MILQTRRVFAAILFLVLAAGLPQISWAWTPPQPVYLAAGLLPPDILPPPPAEGSPGWKDQIKQVIAAQNHISAEEIAAAKHEQHWQIELFTSDIDPTFTRDKYPKTWALLENVRNDIGAVSETDKNYWHTRRPYLTDKHVKLFVDRIDASPAYPSGHTSGSLVVAEVMGMVKPEWREPLRSQADQIAWHRVEAGVHYPVDLEGGRRVGMAVLGALLQSEKFQSDLAAAKAEWK